MKQFRFSIIRLLGGVPKEEMTDRCGDAMNCGQLAAWTVMFGKVCSLRTAKDAQWREIMAEYICQQFTKFDGITRGLYDDEELEEAEEA